MNGRPPAASSFSGHCPPTHAQSAPNTHARTHARIHERIHVRTHARKHTQTYIRTNARTHARVHVRTRQPVPVAQVRGQVHLLHRPEAGHRLLVVRPQLVVPALARGGAGFSCAAQPTLPSPMHAGAQAGCGHSEVLSREGVATTPHCRCKTAHTQARKHAHALPLAARQACERMGARRARTSTRLSSPRTHWMGNMV